MRESSTPGLQQIFGMADGLLNYTRLPDPDDVIEHTQGRPLSDDDELRVVDAAGESVAPGEEGELLARGPYAFNGYFRAGRDNERYFDPAVSSAVATWCAAGLTAIWWSPAGSKMSSAAAGRRSAQRNWKNSC